MIIEIRKEILDDMLKKLSFDNLFPDVIISLKDGCLQSVQTDKHKRVCRWYKLTPPKFKIIKDENVTFMVNVKYIKKFLNMPKSDTYFTLEYPTKGIKKLEGTNVLKIITHYDDGDAKTRLHLKDVEKKYIEKLPFIIKNDLPYVENGRAPLDTHLTMLKESVKDIAKYVKMHKKCNKVKFSMEHNRRKLEVDIIEEDDESNIPSIIKVYSIEEDVDATFSNIIKRVFKCFDEDVEICLRSNFPMYISEINNEFGALIHPYDEIQALKQKQDLKQKEKDLDVYKIKDMDLKKGQPMKLDEFL